MKIKTILALFLLILLILPGSTDTLYAQDILEPVVAGQFYPGDSDELRASIKEYLGKYTTEEFPAGIYGIISPHAGYVYSGPVAAGAYKQLEGRKYDAVVVLAPSHRESFSHVSIYPGDGIRTPLGVINIDKELAKELAEKNKKDIKFSKNGYSGEHSLEVQLPFIQSVLPNTPIVPMVIGHQSFDLSYSLGKSLGAVLKGKNVLVVASTDLSHFHPQAEANKLDGMVADAVGDYDTFLLGQNIFSGQCEACGGTAVIAVMEAAKIMGSNTAKVMKYATSG
ncbi:MAG: AmmeMemoRadiSam system protein B, partial [bacterium]|nr:AmmeMemoRadiSam system protein B [bacterium]